MVNKLPTDVSLDAETLSNFTYENICDEVTEYLSNKYGYCINGYDIKIDIKVKYIDWDTSE